VGIATTIDEKVDRPGSGALGAIRVAAVEHRARAFGVDLIERGTDAAEIFEVGAAPAKAIFG
jgi:hypothetical protein